MIGFDDCRAERDWSAAEIERIKIVAELVGGAIARAAHLKTMADAKRIIESSPTVLFRLAPDPPFGLTYVSKNVHRYGYSADEMLAKPAHWLELVAPDDLTAMMGHIKDLSDGKVDHTQHRLPPEKAGRLAGLVRQRGLRAAQRAPAS